MDNTRLSHLFHITERFQRSVHLERDFYTENALDGYVVTVKARETLSRLISAQRNGATSKAWSLTGPYGSGKSAFALFAAKLLGNSDSATTQQALELLRRGDPSLYEQFVSTNGNGTSLSRYCRVLISGERASLPIALLQGLERGLQNFGIPYARAPRQNIRKLLKASLNDLPPHASEITALFESATRAIEKHGGQGLLLVIDELGKFLEYAAQYPAQGDVFVLQTLAEFATRSDQTPLFLITILHQAFEQYANKLAKSQREEWAKVQGRFEDIAFVEPADQILRLIGSAIQHTPSVRATENLSVPIRYDLKSNQLSRTEFSQLLRNCLPLHPTVALIIGPIFRRFAQNERSLFAFLNASEPYGLQDFLEKQHYDGQTLPVFSIADLYDYLNTAIGSRLSASNEGGKWVEIEMAINRLTDASPTQVKLIKTIGLLGIIGEVSTNLKASESILRYALDDCSEKFTEEFKTALTLLKTERSLAIYRRHSDTYALWEGSDIDIAAKRQEAEQRLDPNEKLMTYLSTLTPPRPLIARRHLFEKGTLRYFAVRYTDLEDFDVHLNEPLGDADGLVLYTLPASETEIPQLIEKAKGTASREEVLMAIPDSTRFLYETVTELAYLQWVWENTPELDNDTVAKRELSHRQIAAEQNVAEQFATVFGDNSKKTCKWFHKGAQVSINPQRARNEYLSKICDTIYDKTPIIWNELINRRKISGAVTTARKKLIQTMLENGDQENLGITSYPAEMSIYRSLLSETGIHREVEDAWGFHPPKQDDKNNIKHTWAAIEDFLETCEGKRQPVVKLYERLMAPPYGVRSGPLPILLCAAMLRYKTEVALYQDGSFIPNWSMPVFERFLKVPEKFEIKRFRIIEARVNLLRQYLNALNRPTETGAPELLTVIKALMPFISRLPKYTLNTEILSDKAKNLRAAVLNAREPDELLFKELPEALGFSAFGVQTTDSNAATKFSSTLQDTLSELGRAYENLLNSIEKQIKDAFVLTGDRDTCREALVHRAGPLREIASEPQLIQFLIRICDEQLDTTNWLEAIGATLAGKPPNSWFDRDTDTFKSNFSQVVRKFRHIEALSYEEREYLDSSAGEPIRIGITRPNQAEQERVVTLTPPADEQTAEMEHEIRKVFDKFDIDNNIELHIAILARISQQWIQQLDE